MTNLVSIDNLLNYHSAMPLAKNIIELKKAKERLTNSKITKHKLTYDIGAPTYKDYSLNIGNEMFINLINMQLEVEEKKLNDLGFKS